MPFVRSDVIVVLSAVLLREVMSPVGSPGGALREIHRQGQLATELRVGHILPAGEDLIPSPAGGKCPTMHSDAD